MPHSIQIIAGELALKGTLNDAATAQNVYRALPIEARGRRWGDEIYFTIPVKGCPDDAMRTEMKPGELAYWPPGSAFCIFWGPTPASYENEPRAASDVVPIGQLTGDLSSLSSVPEGQMVRIEAVR